MGIGSSLEIAKKYFGRHFMNQFAQIKDFHQLPRLMRKNLFGWGGGEPLFKNYLQRGPIFLVRTKEGKKYLVLVAPDHLIITDEYDSNIPSIQVEKELNLPILGLTLRELLEGLIEENNVLESTPKKVLRLTESELIDLIKKTISLSHGNDKSSNSSTNS